MTHNANEPDEQKSDAEPGEPVSDRETPEVGLIADEDLPEDLQPTDDNPLAQDPDEEDESAEQPTDGDR